MCEEMKSDIRKSIIKRNIQLYAFILLGIIGVGIIVTTILGITNPYILSALIPIVLMMRRNAKMWDVYDGMVFLQRYLWDEDFANEYDKNQNK